LGEKRIPKQRGAAGGGRKEGRSPGVRRETFRRDTLLIVAVVSLVVGFVAGMVFQAYRTGAAQKAASALPGRDPSGKGQPRANGDRELSELEGLVSENPEQATAWVRLGHAYFDRDRYPEAIQAYRRSLELDPSDPDVWTDLGVMYRRSGRLGEALQAFDRAVVLDPSHEISRFNKGVVLLHDLNDTTAAIESWEALVRLNPMAVAPNGRPVLELIETVKKERGGE